MANYVIYGTISTSDGIYDTFFLKEQEGQTPLLEII